MANGSNFAGASVLATAQNDLMQDHAHNQGASVGTASSGSGNYGIPVGGGYTFSWHGVQGGAILDNNTNSAGTPRRGVETRPFNISINYCIKY
ncbi:MAG: hypothetical protein QF614_02135 [SAR324 cluster bacterium]|nr:hypothetical protein [SAR324 cluster bacterium]